MTATWPVTGHRQTNSAKLKPALALLAITALALSACTDNTPTTADATTPTAAQTEVTTPAAAQNPTPTEVAEEDATNEPSNATTPDATSRDEEAADAADAGASWQETQWSLEPVASMAEPTALTTRPGSGDLWVTERVGRVRRIERDFDSAAGTERFSLSATVVVDLSDRVSTGGEGGLLGLTFSSDGARLYVHYTDRNGGNVISELPIGDATAELSSERVLLQIDQPFSNHNGGELHLGPDGFLYIGVGDGGSSGDPLGSGQDTSTLLGTILRIDPGPSGGAAYGIPADNPFASSGGAAEIWSWGLRNPYRFSFDRANGDLWIGDVGQGNIEEIDLLPASSGRGAGANLGWNLVEGTASFDGDAPPDHVGPIYEYDHSGGRCSVTGGYVYRGTFSPSLDGVYLFADYCTGELFGLESSGGGASVALLSTDRAAANVISFGQGPQGEVYVLEQGGRISRLQSPDLAIETTVTSG